MTDLIFFTFLLCLLLEQLILAHHAFIVQVPSKVYHARHCFLAQRVVELISIQRC
jgi:hypothetical protein